MAVKFYECQSCDNVAMMAVDSGVTPHCCGQEMMELVGNTTDGSKEKHLPEVEKTGENELTVRIGSAPHPMEEKHFIKFVCLETTCGCVLRYLNPGDKPEVVFHYDGDAVAVYSFCNIHGMWKVEI